MPIPQESCSAMKHASVDLDAMAVGALTSVRRLR